MTDNHYKAAIAIDLGAQSTGLFTVVHPANRFPTKADALTAAVLVPDESGFTASQKSRTMRRHVIRSKKRYAMARRLVTSLFTSLFEQNGVRLSGKDERRFLMALYGLLKRRGYTWLQAEDTDTETALDDFDGFFLGAIPALSPYFHEGRSLAEEWDVLSQNPEAVNQFLKAVPKSDDFKKAFFTAFPGEKAEFARERKALRKLQDLAKNIVRQTLTGNRSRREYFAVIREDMAKDERLKPGIEVCGGLDRFWALICNISNLQLRACRWYFDNKDFAAGDQWIPERLQAVLRRAYLFFEAGNAEEQLNINRLMKHLTDTPDVVEFLCTTDPELSIPPYDRMFNRHPPKDQTLLLSPEALNARYGSTWKLWVSYLERACPELTEGLDTLAPMIDRASRTKETRLPDADYTAARFLQRVLDRSAKVAPFNIRLLASGSDSVRATSDREALTAVIKSQHVERFLAFAEDYYKEVNRAKYGLWFAGKTALLERADIHPPKKNKIVNLLVANLFGITEQQAVLFRRTVWRKTVTGRMTPRSICKGIEDLRINYGNAFKMEYEKARRAYARGASLDKEGKELLRVADRVELLGDFFKSEGLPERCVDRVTNPFSLAQLYNLLEEDREGFSSTSMAAHLENQWRMTGENGAQCCRLPADCVRPFDGMLARLLDRQAFEIAKTAFGEIRRRVTTENATIDCSLIIEENRFAFSADLYTLKGQKAKHDAAQKNVERQQEQWQTKTLRIAADGKNVCPITGRSLAGLEGLRVHIIPASAVLPWMGTIFNSEANFIRVSPEGAAKVKQKRLTLDDLSPAYLEAVFDTPHREVVADLIEKCVASLVKKRKFGFFELLDKDERAAVRHALFLGDDSPARRTVIQQLGTLNKTLVNGTQPWLIKLILQKLNTLSAEWRKTTGNEIIVNAWKMSPQDVADLRAVAARGEKTWAKTPSSEAIPSQALDALCAYAVSAGIPMLCRQLGADPRIADTETYITERPLPALCPDECRVIRITRKPTTEKRDTASRTIFKDGMYAEHFLPVLVRDGAVRLGFTFPRADGTGGNSIPVNGNGDAFLAILAPFFTKPLKVGAKGLQTYHINYDKAFKAFRFFARIGNREAVPPDESLVVYLLEALRYETKRQPVKAALLDVTGTKYLSRDKVSVKTSLNVKRFADKAAGFAFAGSVELPCRAQWNEFFDAPQLQDKWGKKLSDCEGFDLDAFLVSKTTAEGEKRAHAPYRDLVSLPVVQGPSFGVRIERSNYFNHRTVWQLQDVKGAPFTAIAAEEGKIAWDTPLMRSCLLSKHSTPSRFDVAVDNGIREAVKLTERRRVATGPTGTADMAIDSDSRRKLWITTDFETFRRWLQAEGFEELPDSPQELKGEYAAKKWVAISTFFPDLAQVMNQPRGKIYLENCGTQVSFFYKSQNLVKSMNTAFESSGR